MEYGRSESRLEQIYTGIFSFWDKNNLVVLTPWACLRSLQKTPQNEIKIAESYKKEYFRRKEH